MLTLFKILCIIIGIVSLPLTLLGRDFLILAVACGVIIVITQGIQDIFVKGHIVTKDDRLKWTIMTLLAGGAIVAAGYEVALISKIDTGGSLTWGEWTAIGIVAVGYVVYVLSIVLRSRR